MALQWLKNAFVIFLQYKAIIKKTNTQCGETRIQPHLTNRETVSALLGMCCSKTWKKIDIDIKRYTSE